MKLRYKAVFLAVLCAISASFTLTGCVKETPNPEPKYFFSAQGLTELPINADQSLNILSNAVGAFIENKLLEGTGLLNYSVVENMEISQEFYDISLKLKYDSNASQEGELNRSLDLRLGLEKDKLLFGAIGIKDNIFFAEKLGKNGELLRFENDPSFLGSLLDFSGGNKGKFAEQLKTLLRYVSFSEDSTHYGLKKASGEEISELTLSVNLFSSIFSLTRVTIALKGQEIDEKYPILGSGNTEENKAKRKEEKDHFTAKINELSQFLFEIDYTEIVKMPTMFLNINFVMTDKVASKIIFSVSATPKFVKTSTK